MTGLNIKSGAGALIACVLLAITPAARATDDPPLTGEFGEILKVVNLEGAQRDAYLAACKNFHNDIMQIQRTVQRDIDALSDDIRKAREKGDAKQIAALEEKLKPLNAKYWQMREEARYKILAVLTPEQQAIWVGAQLKKRVERAIARAQPTTEQMMKVQALCFEEIAMYMKERPEYLKEDPYLRTIGDHCDTVVARVIASVLTDLQKERMQPDKSGPAGQRSGGETFGMSENGVEKG